MLHYSFWFSCWFWVVLIVSSIILIILIMMEFTKEILSRLKMFYKDNERKSKTMFIIQKFWGRIWYMSTSLVITFDRKIVLMHWKLDFKSFPTVYYMPNSDNQARNDNCLKFAKLSAKNADSTSWSWKWTPSRLFLLDSTQPIFSILLFCIIFFYLYSYLSS